MQKSMGGGGGKEVPSFFSSMREEFLQKCIELGMEFTDVEDFLEIKGIPECNMELVIDNINNPRYVNILK